MSYDRNVDVQITLGSLPAAPTSYQASLRLVETDPGSSLWQRELIVSCAELARVNQTDAPTFLVRAQIAEHMQRKGQLAPPDQWMVDAITKLIAALPR